ncbi:hypothetical protein ACL02U_32170 [Streptomyces sp. MS06]|uniref:hypothetical protein n=1 Tax=Streptomyces sp. MS06 TaxID=3385974 RepID=UPI0039A15F2D
MADSQSNAPSRAGAGAPGSGVIHVRTRLTADFTVIANALAQRRGSAVTVGVAAYIASLPDGSPVTIHALCAHFTEGEILVSRALRELEAAGYLERRRERTPTGQVRTRTYFYDVPTGTDDDGPGGGGPGGPDDPPRPPRPPRPRTGTEAPGSAPRREAAPAPDPGEPRDSAVNPIGDGTVDPIGDGTVNPTPAPADVERSAPAEAGTAEPAHAERAVRAEAETAALADADPEAVAVLTALRRVDPRLVLSAREAARLAPAVAEWLAAGVGPREITELLTVRLPDRFRARPASVLSFRLRETPLPTPPHPAPRPDAGRPAVLPFQTCDGCERAFRAPEPGHCRSCRARHDDREHLRAAG